MIIPRLGYDVRKGSSRVGPPDVDSPTKHAERELPAGEGQAASPVEDREGLSADGPSAEL
jgi:hypothetical protein